MAGTKDTSLEERNRRIRLLRRNGFTYDQIADMEHISRVRVSQIVHEADGEPGEEEARAEIASLLEYAERKAVELVTDPGYALAPNGRAATDPDGNPILNKGIVGDALRTLVVIADRKAKLWAADKVIKRRETPEEMAYQQMRAALEVHTAKMEADDRVRRAEIAELKQLRGPQVIVGEIERGEEAVS